jgi:glycosyltransferase involved in cell wall biosynthesis
MPERIFASLDDFDPPQAGRGRVGRRVANHFFFRALMTHGTFDEYHFILANSAHVRQFRENHADLIGSFGDRVRVRTRLDLIDAVGRIDYTVFHQSDHLNGFNALCRLRNDMGAAIPVTAFVHSLSYQEQMGAFLEMLHTDVREYDGLISSSACGREVLANCFERLSAGFSLPEAAVDLTVIPLGIAEEATPMERGEARMTLGIAPDAVVGLCFGRFSDFDKMDLFPLLQALAQVVKDRTEPWRLILAGAVHDTTYLELVKLWIRALGLGNRVDIVVEPDEDNKKALFAASDFFVSVADNPQETFGMTLVEALWAGLPLIVSDFNGYREIGADDVALRVPTTWGNLPELARVQPLMDDLLFSRLSAQMLEVDVDALADALLAFYTDDALRRRLGEAATRRFAETYSHRHIISQLEAYWDGLKDRAQEHSRPSASAPAVSTEDDPLCISIFDTFAHYVTRFLDDGDMVQMTDFARGLASRGSSYPLLPSMKDIIDVAEVAGILSNAVEPKQVASFLSGREGDWRRRYMLLWMLKHGLLKRV